MVAAVAAIVKPLDVIAVKALVDLHPDVECAHRGNSESGCFRRMT